MFYKLITLLVATVALAAPTNKKCFSKTKYSLNMFLPTTNEVTPLYALDKGPPGNIVLAAYPALGGLPGTPIYETGVAPTTALNVKVNEDGREPLSYQSGVYHLSVMDMGERHGDATSVLGSKDFEWPHWITSEERVWPMQTSAAQVFFACEVTDNTGILKYTALSWGLASSDGSMPAGCYGTIVAKQYNIQIPC